MTRLRSFSSAVFQSTHSVGSGTRVARWRLLKSAFQSTHSVGSGTNMLKNVYQHIMISIHPLRGEWDALPFWKRKKEWLFQSTHSVGSGTSHKRLRRICYRYFNPPTPWGVGPSMLSARLSRRRNFNPPTPWGVGRNIYVLGLDFLCISIHPLRGEWD